jgi:putative phosphoserine phosphatase/1-acylglycerol-3-phosphate O-acyltransferase
VRQLYLDTLANWPVDELPEVDLYADKEAAKKAKAKPATKAAVSKTPAKETTAKNTATKTKPAKADPHASKVALKDGEVQQPSRPRGRP